MSFKLFITGTDTDIGKTFVSASLVKALENEGVKYWKPVQTGYPDDDCSTVEEMTSKVDILPPNYCYTLPASPDQAAEHESKEAPNLEKLVRATSEVHGPLIIEGAGGLKVPLNNDGETWLDYLKETKLETVLVARTGLGTLNHTSMTLDLLELNNVKIRAVILNGERHEANELSLKRMHPKINFLHFPKFQQTLGSEWLSESSNLAHCLEMLDDTQERTTIFDDDRRHCWHPYTQHKGAEDPVHITTAKGPWLSTSKGEKLLDGTSSWWSNTIGHGHPAIAKAIYKQQQSIDHVIFAGATHEGAVKLSRRLSALTRHKLPKVFFTDNGSCAVEVAMKMAIQRFVNQGIKGRNKFITLEGAYHGDTFGAMSVGGSDGFHNAFKDFMFESHVVTPVTEHPSSLCPKGKDAYPEEIEKLKALFNKESSKLAGLIVEPYIQGASGMNIQHEPWLKDLCQLAKYHDIPIIFDEVFTGLGRCGDIFAYQRLDLDPDIVCIAKGLTGGNLPLAATLAKDEIYLSFFDEDKTKALYHGHTYTANAICCAAANATLDLYEDEHLVSRSQELERRFKTWISTNSRALELKNPRAAGAILAWELPGTGFGDYFHDKASLIPQLAREHGLFLRPLGNTLYFLPSLRISDKDLEFSLDALERTMKSFLSRC